MFRDLILSLRTTPRWLWAGNVLLSVMMGIAALLLSYPPMLFPNTLAQLTNTPYATTILGTFLLTALLIYPWLYHRLHRLLTRDPKIRFFRTLSTILVQSFGSLLVAMILYGTIVYCYAALNMHDPLWMISTATLVSMTVLVLSLSAHAALPLLFVFSVAQVWINSVIVQRHLRSAQAVSCSTQSL